MNHLEGTAWLKIHDGKLAEFKNLASQFMAIVKAKDTGTLQYDWYFNEDETVCVIKEKYMDSAAVYVHLGNVGDLLAKVGLISDFTVEFYGNPSEELRAALLGAGVKIYSFFGGL